MTILFLRSGLGNQLFEFSYAYKLMQDRGEEKLYINISSYRKEPDGRSVEISKMNLPENVEFLGPLVSKWFEFLFLIRFAYVTLYNKICHKKQKSYTECGIMREMFEYNPEIPKNRIVLLRGFYQNAHYLEGVSRDELEKRYTPKNGLKDYQQIFVEELKDKESVCVHIRRGDYITNPAWAKGLNICNEQYYINAINRIKEQVQEPVFYCFTNDEDDANWIRENYKLPCELHFITFERTDLEEFKVMSACRHFVLSNSSFGWWAAYLSDNSSKKIMMPSLWNKSVDDCSGMYPEGWEKVEIE